MPLAPQMNKSPAVRGKAVCRMHGAWGGAPVGNKNARKHGLYGRESIELRRAIALLVRESREMVEVVQGNE